MKIVAALQKQEVLGKGQIYVDLRSAFLTPDGEYTDKGPDETGEVSRLRSRDGIAFLDWATIASASFCWRKSSGLSAQSDRYAPGGDAQS